MIAIHPSRVDGVRVVTAKRARSGVAHGQRQGFDGLWPAQQGTSSYHEGANSGNGQGGADGGLRGRTQRHDHERREGDDGISGSHAETGTGT